MEWDSTGDDYGLWLGKSEWTSARFEESFH